jgi:tRNA pseudouridine55 synthase
LKVHGLLLLDKPKGLSSNAALQQARRLFDADKAGHGGTLDPMADGLLPVMFGEACKLAESALEGDKAYEATMRLGQVTDTDDTEGEVVASAPVDVSKARLNAVLARFRGRIEQVPPVYSAIKVAGKPLYRYARSGSPVQAAARQVTIHKLDLLAVRCEDEPSLSIRVDCSKGTYIRSLARDIGDGLGCGAHLIALRRTRVGRFDIRAAVSLDALADMTPHERARQLVGLEQLVSDWPSVMLDQASAARFCQGQAVPLGAQGSATACFTLPGDGVAEPSTKIAVHCGGRLIGLGRSTLTTESIGALAPVRIIVS